jgi:hypothetical protein
MHGALSLRPTAPAHNRTQDPVARQPWMAPVIRAPGSHGPRVRARRSALSDPDRAGQTRHTAASAPAVPPVGETLKKLLSPTLAKALTFLDDTLLPATSNAVERGNRR